MNVVNGVLRLRDIAGFCPEEAVWKMMADMSEYLLKERTFFVLTPDSVIIDGNSFMVETGHKAIDMFSAPEFVCGGKTDVSQMVWSLGAVAYYMATGHVIFGGHGSNYQKEHPSVALPVLPKNMQNLTPVLQRCLCYNSEKRINLEELNILLQKGLATCKQLRRQKIAEGKEEEKKDLKNVGEKWPEEMTEV